LRIGIGIVAIWVIIAKLKDNFIDFCNQLISNIHYELIVIALVLVFFNWGIEAAKWKYLIYKTEKITFFTAFKLTITGITLGLITPNRIGEIPGRALLLNNKNKLKELIVKTSVGAYSQLVITFLFGTVAAFFTLKLFDLELNTLIINLFLVIVTCFMVASYFLNYHLKNILYKIPYIKKNNLLDALQSFNLKELLCVLVLSCLRYMVFSLQYYLILKAFNIYFNSWMELFLIPLCFMVTSVIPTLLLSEIGVRGSVALFIFGIITNNHLVIVSASILLWLINVALPALIGLVFIKRFQIVSEN
jgi:uncharacterized membrane protein YbhN (UPF0104 family)